MMNLKMPEDDAIALYDGGWRSKDKKELQEEYGFTDEESGVLSYLLEKIEKEEHDNEHNERD